MYPLCNILIKLSPLSNMLSKCTEKFCCFTIACVCKSLTYVFSLFTCSQWTALVVAVVALEEEVICKMEEDLALLRQARKKKR